jgi:hypothetical protein
MFNYLVLKHTKSKLTKAISKLITKIGNLRLKIDMQSARRTKLGTVTRKPPKLETKLAFLARRQKCYPKIVPK